MVKKKIKKNKKRKINKGRTKTEYDEEIVGLNRELAAVWQNVADIELHQKRMIDVYQAVCENFDSIKENLQQEIQTEGTKLEATQKRLTWLELKKQKQIEDYEKTIQELQNDTENSTINAKTKIEQINATLKILKDFDKRRQVYLKEEEKISESEKKVEKTHERELYDEDRKIRAEEVPIRAEAAEKLSSVMDPLLLRLGPASETIKLIKSEENIKLEERIEERSCQLLKLVAEFDHLKNTECDLKLEIDCWNIGNVHKGLKKKCPGISVKITEIENQATQTEKFVPLKPERLFPLDDIEHLVKNVLNVDEFVYGKEEFFDQQEEIFEMIHVKISQLLQEHKIFFVAPGYDFSERPKPNRLKFFRPTLHRSLRESNQKTLKKLYQEFFGN